MKKSTIKAILLICILLLTVQVGSSRSIAPIALAQQAPLITDPQYIFVRKAPKQSQTFPFDARDPNTIVKGGFEEIINTVGTLGTNERKLGIAILFDLQDSDLTNLRQSLQKSIQYSKETKLPLLIKLDVINWWGRKPELWNWFDQSLPGFDVNNKANVEWTSYDASSATKIGWRNWGLQVRTQPHPNLASPKFRQAQKEVLDQLLPDIKAFKDSLSPQDQYLFGGVVLGSELAVGANFFYYPNGNLAYETCPSYEASADPRGPCANLPTTDPKYFLDPTTNVNYTDPNFPKLGYNAAKTLGIRTSGELTAADNDSIIQNYFAYLNNILKSYNIPANKSYTHAGGSLDGGIPGFKGTYNAGKIDALTPGWSFYGYAADSPGGYSATHPVLSEFMTDANNATYPWITPEWFPSANYKNKAGWVSSLRNTLNYKNNKLIGVGNWESIFGCVERNPDYSCKVNITNRDFNGGNNAIQAIAEVLNEPTTSYCTVSPSYLLSTTKQGTQTILQGSVNKTGTTTYINGSVSKELNAYGVLKTPSLINTALDPSTQRFTYTGTHTGTAYVQFITDGCGGKRNVSEVFTVQLGSDQTSCPKKSQGDANCDGRITTIDFEIWRQEFQKTLNTKQTDFDGNGSISLGDFEIWRRVFSLQ